MIRQSSVEEERPSTVEADRGAPRGDSGSAIIEFLFVAVLVLIPLIYLIVAVAVVQRSRVSVSDAARAVGRALATADSADDLDERTQAALRISLHNRGYAPEDVELRYVAAHEGCEAPGTPPVLLPGGEFTVCVIRHEPLPAVPTVLAGRGITVVGKYVVHVDDFRVPTSS